MKNVIQFNFITGQTLKETPRAMTKIELFLIEKRIDEIDLILSDDNCPDDVCETLETELNSIMDKLHISFLVAENNERLAPLKGKRKKGKNNLKIAG